MNSDLFIGLCCDGFMVAIISITICYALYIKHRWMCYTVKSTRSHLPCLLPLLNSCSLQCRGDMPVAGGCGSGGGRAGREAVCGDEESRGQSQVLQTETQEDRT